MKKRKSNGATPGEPLLLPDASVNGPPFPIEDRRVESGAKPDPDESFERGTTQHYADATLYDHEYRRRRADLNYYRALAGGRMVPLVGMESREVLELGCGSGRLMVPLLRDGLRVTGVDLAAAMLRRCAERISRVPTARPRARLVRADFRGLRLRQRFPLVIAPFNAMMHLYRRDDVERFLATVREHLAPGGTFAFDVLNPDLAWLVRDPRKRWARTRFKDPRTGRIYFYSTNHLYDPAKQVNSIRLYYEEEPPPPSEKGARSVEPGDLNRAAKRSTGARREGDLTLVEGSSSRNRGGGAPSAGRFRGSDTPSQVVELTQRQFFPEELEALLHYNGFRIDAREGGFVGEPFESDSESQVCRCSILQPRRR